MGFERKARRRPLRIDDVLGTLLTARWVFFVAAIGAILLVGGSSRPDVTSTIGVELLAVLILAVGAAWGVRTGPDLRTPMVILLAWAAMIAVQLIPLPPALWTALPGRALVQQVDVAAGLGPVWRPLTLQPDRTLSALLAMLVPVATLVALAGTMKRAPYALCLTLLAIGAVSLIIGLVQVGLGGKTAYPYALSDFGLPIGVFPNRNHQALMLVLVIPVVVAIGIALYGRGRWGAVTAAVILSTVVLIEAVVLATGSRLGVFASVVAIALSAVMVWRSPALRGKRRRASGFRLVLLAGGGLFFVAFFALVAIIGDAVGLQVAGIDRLFVTAADGDSRVDLWWRLIPVIGGYFPAGAGFGSFADVFPAHETAESLKLYYYNHAHNEAIEILFEGGAPALVLAVAGMIMFVRRAALLWRMPMAMGDERLLTGRLGTVLLILLVIGCITDYPLRNSTLACVFALAMGLMWGFGAAAPPRPSAHIVPAEGADAAA